MNEEEQCTYRKWLRDRFKSPFVFPITILPSVLVDIILDYTVPAPIFELYTRSGLVGKIIIELFVLTLSCENGNFINTTLEWRANTFSFDDGISSINSSNNRIPLISNNVKIFDATGRVFISGEHCLFINNTLSESSTQIDSNKSICNCNTDIKSLHKEKLIIKEIYEHSAWKMQSLYPISTRAFQLAVVANRWIWFQDAAPFDLFTDHSNSYPMYCNTFVYDAVTCSWNMGPLLIEERYKPLAVVVGMYLFLFGGYNRNTKKYLESCCVLDTTEYNTTLQTPFSCVHASGENQKQGWQSVDLTLWPNDFRPSSILDMGDGIVRLAQYNSKSYDFDSNEALRTINCNNNNNNSNSIRNKENKVKRSIWRTVSDEDSKVNKFPKNIYFTDPAWNANFRFTADRISYTYLTLLEMHVENSDEVNSKWKSIKITGKPINATVYLHRI